VELFVQAALGFGLVDADTAGFRYPETTGKRPVSDGPQQGVDQRLENRKSRVSRQTQDNNPGAAVGWESSYVAEVDVQRDKAATLSAAGFEKLSVWTTAESLTLYRGGRAFVYGSRGSRRA
jgi:hypothetical protein